MDRRVIEVIDPIYKAINPEENWKFSKLSIDELNYLLEKINGYYLDYRKNLNFSNKASFGIELEFDYLEKNEIENRLIGDKLLDWTFKSDVSFNPENKISSPVLYDTQDCWDDLYNICVFLKSNINIFGNCINHIYIGTQLLGYKTLHWENFFKLWGTYENILFRFLYGEWLNASCNILKNVSLVSDSFFNYVRQIENKEISVKNYLMLRDILGDKKNQAVIFSDAKAMNVEMINNTIEFRCLNGTVNPIILQNNINVLVKVIEYATSKRFNKDIIEERYKINKDILNDITLYEQIYLEQAVEFADLIFSKNVDKIYFLRQYLKSYEICDIFDNVLAKEFTRIR